MAESTRINWLVMACSLAGHGALAAVIAAALLVRPAVPSVADGDPLTFRMLEPVPAQAIAPVPPAAVASATPTMIAPRASPATTPAPPVSRFVPPGAAPVELPMAAAASGPHLHYQRLLHDLIAQQAHYPAAAVAAQAAGLTRLGFRLDRLGHVLDTWVQGSSGVAALDGAAIEALRRADPLPPVPPVLPAPITFVIEFDAAAQAAMR